MIPVLSVDLIKQLDESYPPHKIRPAESIEAIMFHAGMRKVVQDLLDRQQADEEENRLDRKILPNLGD